jgi:type 1 glutamine amidotransferase
MRRALLLLGGSYHDFDGYAKWFSELLSPLGWEVESTYDLDRLTKLEEENFELVASYTCFSSNPDLKNQRGSGMMQDEQVDALYNWVHAGGTFYAAHAATALGETNMLYTNLIGGRFLNHPPAFEFTVYPMYETHEITQGIGAFSVTDEFYIEEYDGDLDILMVGLLDDVIHPLVWCKQEGLGRVAHNALGHTPAVWNTPQYKKLTLQSIDWLLDWIK